jgi:hypothetical protein
MEIFNPKTKQENQVATQTVLRGQLKGQATIHRTQTCSMEIDMEMKHRHEAWTCTMNMDTQHGHGLEPWIWTCNIDMHHGHGT